MSYLCTVCDQTFPDIPEDAVQIAGGRGRSRLPATYAFSDGSFHYLRKKPEKKQAPSEPQPEPKQDSELEVANTELPIPPVPDTELKTEPLPPVEPDIEEAPTTAMQLAFRRSRLAA